MTTEWPIFLGCLILSIGAALWARRRNRSRDDFFFAGRRVSWWLVGMSLSANCICGADISAISGWVFLKDLKFSAALLLSPILVLVYTRLWMPVWKALGANTVFEYLEKRFSRLVRVLCGAIFVLGGLVLIASPMYLSALFLAEFTGWSFFLLVTALAVLVGIYSVLGGAKADILTDCVQLVVFMSGILFALLYSASEAGGMAAVWQTASEEVSTVTGQRHTTMLSWDLSLSKEATIWALMAFHIQVSVFFGVNQMMVQRVQCTSTDRNQRKALWLMTGINMLCIALLALLGLGLVAYRSHNPAFGAGLGPDEILPRYVALTFPAGLRGLMLATILLATMSTVDSGLNSYANVILTDFLEKYLPERQTRRLRTSQWIVSALCILTLGLAVLLSLDRSASIIQKVGRTCATLGAPVTAAFLAGLFVRRASSLSLLCGMGLGLATFLWISHSFSINWMWFFLIGLICSLTWVALLSYLFPARSRDTGCTWRELRAQVQETS